MGEKKAGEQNEKQSQDLHPQEPGMGNPRTREKGGALRLRSG
jgi:hypothetical protein